MVEAHHVFNIPRIIITVKIIYFHQSGMWSFKYIVAVQAVDEVLH